MDENMIREINGVKFRIKSRQHFGYMIEDINNKEDVRRISPKGWEQATVVEGEK